MNEETEYVLGFLFVIVGFFISVVMMSELNVTTGFLILIGTIFLVIEGMLIQTSKEERTPWGIYDFEEFIRANIAFLLFSFAIVGYLGGLFYLIVIDPQLMLSIVLWLVGITTGLYVIYRGKKYLYERFIE